MPKSDLPLEVVAHQQAGRGRRIPRRVVIVAALVTLGVAGLVFGPAVLNLLPSSPGQSQKPVAAAGPTTPAGPRPLPAGAIAALGRLEPADGVVAITPPKASRDAVVRELRVAAGATVRAGETLAVLETLARAEAALAEAQAEVGVRTAELARARRTVEAGQAETDAQVALAQARLRGAEQALVRADRLVASSAVTAARLEELQTERDALIAELARAQAQRLRMEGALDNHPDILAARAALAAAQAAVQRSRIEVEEAIVRSPADGRIIAVSARVGEPSPSDGLMRLATDGPFTAILEVHQDRIHRVRVGAGVSLRAPAFTGEITGRVQRIGIEVQRQAVFAEDPAANTDARVFEVTVALDPAFWPIARDLINLQVLGAIETDAGA